MAALASAAGGGCWSTCWSIRPHSVQLRGSVSTPMRLVATSVPACAPFNCTRGGLISDCLESLDSPMLLMPLRLPSFVAGLCILLSLGAASPDAVAQERRVPASPNEARLSYAPIVQRVAPAV